jgi:phosphogluconate dehydratase
MDQGHQVGLVTDGRLSGASGKVPFAIHCTPEALAGGLLAKVQDGDLIRLDARHNLLELKVDTARLATRTAAAAPAEPSGVGQAIFAPLRRVLAGAEDGASSLFT